MTDQSSLLTEHPCNEDYQLILNAVVSHTKPVWQKYGSIIPFGVILTKRNTISLIGGPEELPIDCIDILSGIKNKVVYTIDTTQAVALVQLTIVKKHIFIQAVLDHCNGPSLRAFYELPKADHWWVETHPKSFWLE